MEKDVEERKFVGGGVVETEEVSLTVVIAVGKKVEVVGVSEDDIEVVSIEEEGRETIFEVEKDVEERKVVGSFVNGCRVVETKEGEEVVKDGKVVCGIKVDGGRVEGGEVTKQQLQYP